MADEILCPKCSASNPRETAFCGKCGEKLIGTGPLEEQGDPLIGALIGDRFLVHEKLGEGGMGVVYRAEQTAIKRPVALKVLHSQLTEDKNLHARFKIEAEASSRLQHPNTVTIFDFGQTETGSLYIAMEFIKGRSLDDEIRDNGSMDVGRVRHIMGQICGSLSDAHAHKIVHRDLKPENIMLCDRAGQTDVVKVLDFGIAKVLEDDGQDQMQALTKTGMVFGTPQYMSPEQIRGEQVDHRTDIYSLGVIMYQMLTGVLPFTADTPMGALSKHLVDPPPKFIDTNGEIDIPDALESVVMATLAKDAADRPQSMHELSEQLFAASAEYGPATSAFGTGPGSTVATPAGTAASPSGATMATPAPGGGSKPDKPLPKTQVQSQKPAGAPPVVAQGKSKKGLVIGITVTVVLLLLAVVVGWYIMAKRAQNQVVPQPQTPVAPVVQPVVQPPVAIPTPPVVQPPVVALPAVPANNGTSTNNTPKPPKDVKCRYLPVTNNDIIAKGILSSVKRKEKGLRDCIRKGASGKTVFKFSIPKNKSQLTSARVAQNQNNATVTSCLKSVLTGNFGTNDPRKIHRGGAVFDVKYKSKVIRKCNVVITAAADGSGPAVVRPGTGSGKQ